MPGFTRVSETDNVVSVSKKVNDLNIPVDALQAWDSELITGEPVYLVLLMSFKMYPVDVDNGTRGEPRFKMGISPKYKPSHNAVAAAFRTQSANTYTGELVCQPRNLQLMLLTLSSLHDSRRLPSHLPVRTLRRSDARALPKRLAYERAE